MFRRRKRVLIAAVLAVSILIGGFGSAHEKLEVNATSTTRQEIEQQEQEREELANELNQNQNNLQTLQGESNTLKRELGNLNEELTAVSDNLSDLEQQIRDKEQEIAEAQDALDEAREIEEWQYNSMIVRIRNMYEYGDISYMDAVLNAGSFSDMVTTADRFERIAEYSQLKLDEFRENRRLIEEWEAVLQADKAELENLKVQVLAEQNRVNGLISQTSNSIAQYESNISDVERQILEKEEEIRKADENLETLRQRLAQEIAMSQQAASSTWRDISEVTFADTDRYLLANLIYCEAGGEPDEGQLAVGSVVINRVLSSVYPDTVTGVIYQNRQFSPVASGRLALALAENRATERCYRAADQAMSGVTNVGNCVYFRTPIEGLSGINIGGHVFY
ncbi:MAG: cell wall hydrolase [Candidatus Gastranaerophilales bacterium]|nr:cell wall hydrolase [Candidatus Gastranaerophilales bacterium]